MALLAKIQAVFDAYVECYEAKDVRGCTAFYTTDGAIYSPYGHAALGQSALARVHEEWFAADESNKRIVVSEARSSGDLAYCLASYSGDYPQEGGGSVTENGTSLNVLMRGPGGQWKIRISSLNSDTPLLAS